MAARTSVLASGILLTSLSILLRMNLCLYDKLSDSDFIDSPTDLDNSLYFFSVAFIVHAKRRTLHI